LHIPGNGRFLIEDYVIQVVPSLRWLEPETSPRPPSHALLVGVTSPAPDYPELPPLKGATAEVAAIAQHYGSPTVLADDAASPERLLAEIQHHDVLHFAGHALTPARRPDLAHLVLARSTIPIEQLRRLDLARLQLAVLASCSTLGDFSADSQGFESLARAFLDAGARGVVGTLWEIEDRHAQALLTDFHRLVATGTEPASALRNAQLKIINGQRGRNADVALWAGYRYEGR
jgi:CHAT domain-containing protein